MAVRAPLLLLLLLVVVDCAAQAPAHILGRNTNDQFTAEFWTRQNTASNLVKGVGVNTPAGTRFTDALLPTLISGKSLGGQFLMTNTPSLNYWDSTLAALQSWSFAVVNNVPQNTNVLSRIGFPEILRYKTLYDPVFQNAGSPLTGVLKANGAGAATAVAGVSGTNTVYLGTNYFTFLDGVFAGWSGSTNFTGAGIQTLNGDGAANPTFATGTGGSDFAVSTTGGVTTFNLPAASATKRGALTSADWSTFNSKQAGTDLLTAVSALSGNGALHKTGTSTLALRTLTGGTGITIDNADGIAGNPEISVDASALPISSAEIVDGTIVNADVNASAAIAGTKIDAGTTTTRGTVELATDGENAANVVVQGNDARLSDTRTPTDNSVTSAKIVDGAVVNADVNASAAIDATKLANGTVNNAELQSILIPTPATFTNSIILGNGGTALSRTGTNPVDPLPFESDGTFNGIYNTFFGINAGLTNNTGNMNVFVGNDAGRANRNGDQNTFVGSFAGEYNTSGYHNTYLGTGAGQNNTTGYFNTFVGTDSGLYSQTGTDNTYTGTSSGAGNFSGNQNSFFGVSAGLANTTSGNSGFGYLALAGTTTGVGNVGSGWATLYRNTIGYYNTAVGYAAGYGLGTISNATYSVFLGMDSRSVTENIQNSMALGWDTVVTNSNQVVVGNASITQTILRGAVSGLSFDFSGSTDATITRAGAGDIAVEGNTVYRAGGTDVPITDGGTGASTAAAAVDALGGASSSGTGGLVRITDPVILRPPSALGAFAIDVTKVDNTKTSTGDHTWTFSAAGSDGQMFGLTLTGHSADTTQTLPANCRSAALGGATLSTFLLKANQIVYLTFQKRGSNYDVWGDPTTLNNLDTLTPVVGDYLLFYDSSAAAEGKATIANIVSPQIGVTLQAYDADLTTVGAGGTGARDFLGLGTGDSPQFTAVELSHASANTLTGSSGDALIEGNVLYRAGGTDVPVTDGGTGRSTGTTAYSLVATGTTATGAQQTLANGATTEILVGGGASALPVWTTATGTGAPVRATSPTLVTPTLGAAEATSINFSDTPSHLEKIYYGLDLGTIPTMYFESTNSFQFYGRDSTTSSGNNANIIFRRSDGYVGGFQWSTAQGLHMYSQVGLPIIITTGAGGGNLHVNVSGGTAITSTGNTTINHPVIDLATSMGTDDTGYGTVRIGRNNSGGVTQWDAVYLNSSSQWVLADANGSGTYPAKGIVTATASTGNASTVVTQGTIRNDAWAWTPGGTIYLSVTAGGLTQTAPSAVGDKVQVMGYALDADTMAVEIGDISQKVKYFDFQRPDYGDGAGAIPQTNSYVASGLMHYTLSGSAATNVNYVRYEWAVPEEIDTSTGSLKITRFKFSTAGTSTSQINFHVAYGLVPVSAGRTPTMAGHVLFNVTPSSVTALDLFEASNVTICATSALTAGQKIVIEIARDGADSNNDAITEDFLRLEFPTTQ